MSKLEQWREAQIAANHKAVSTFEGKSVVIEPAWTGELTVYVRGDMTRSIRINREDVAAFHAWLTAALK